METKPQRCLGKKPAKRDPRNVQFKDVLRAVVLPSHYDFDVAHPDIPLRMYLNDQLGDCVIAARANLQERLTTVATAKIINILDDEVKTEYFGETGGGDDGLVILDSLKAWVNKGWVAGGHVRKIRGFAEIDRTNPHEIKSAIFGKVGVIGGFMLPTAADSEFSQGKEWIVTRGPNGEPGSWGGHAMTCKQYDSTKSTTTFRWMTWAAIQPTSWGWMKKYCDELYAVVDDAASDTVVDVAKLDELVQQAKEM